jgi:hypothetical protein
MSLGLCDASMLLVQTFHTALGQGPDRTRLRAIACEHIIKID